MKHIYILFFFVFFFNIAFAQRPEGQRNGGGGMGGNGGGKPQQPKQDINEKLDNVPKGNAKITGILLDEKTKQPVEFAAVALVDILTGKTINGTTTNDKGMFSIPKVAEGKYKLMISFVGYQTKTVDNVEVPAKGEKIVGTVYVAQDSKLLDEVVVTGEQELVENKIDKMVYNADKDLTNTGGDAADVLRKVPMLSVDLDGNVQLRGSGNIRVLINNKPSTIIASNLADALRQIPADMIKSVEVITNPSAKYDAEGTAGIINIITKKSNVKGLTGSINATGGNQRSGLGGDLNIRTNKIGINMGLGANLFYAPFKSTNTRENFSQFGNTLLTQTSEGDNLRGFGRGNISIDYDIDPKNTLNFGFRAFGRGFQSDNVLNTLFADQKANPLQQQSRSINNLNYGMNYNADLNYTRTFKKEGQELAILTQYSINDGKTEYSLEQLNRNRILNYQERNNNDNKNVESTVQVDYTHPIKDGSTFEVGAKAILRYVGSDFQLSKADSGQTAFTNVAARSNVFNYDQDVYSSYATYGITTTSKWGLKVGVRYEYTDIRANFETTNIKFTQKYDNWIPSLAISKDLGKAHKLRLSYTQRIQRPSIFFLNPFRNEADAKNISFGKPDLDPELTHSYELNYNTFWKQNSLNISAYWRNTNNAISSIITVDSEGVSTTTYDNVAQNETFGASVFGSTNLTKNWKVSGNINVFYSIFRSPAYESNNEGLMYNLNLNMSYEFGNGWSAQAFGMINSPSIQLQGKSGNFSFYNAGIKKDFWKKKASLTLTANNFLAETFKIKSDFSSPAFRSENVVDLYIRQISLNFRYAFGKMEFNAKPKRRKKGVNNDDTKEGGGGDN